jgi:hypothetical protein
VTVLRRFFELPDRQRQVVRFFFLIFFFPYFGGQNSMVWAVVRYFPNFIQPMFKEGVMTSNNTKSNHTEVKEGQGENKKNALIFINHYSTAKLSEIERICTANNLSVDRIIYNYTLHDIRPYKEMIKYIIKQKTPPIVLIDNTIRLFPQCIMSSSILGTLEEMRLAIIHTYNKKTNKDYNLTITTDSIFDLLTDATWQLRSIEKLYKKDKNKVIDEK